MVQPTPELYQPKEPSREGRLNAYLWDRGEAASAEIARSLHDPRRPMANYAVPIPVAAHQDAAWIVDTMSQYAGQKGADPFTIFLLLNCPDSKAHYALGKSIAQVEKARRLFPLLDIRYATTTYEEPVIGRICKDLWDAVLRVSLTDGLYDQPGSEVIGLNHNIDTEVIGHYYMRNVQGYYQAQQAYLNKLGFTDRVMSSRFTQVRHAYPFTTHPNIARAIFWSELVSRQFFREGALTAGLAIPFSYYAKQGGFDKNAVIKEGIPLAPDDDVGIPHTTLSTSPRRYIERIGNNHLAEIWTEESFSATDACRVPNALPTDISHAELEERIFNTLETDIRVFCLGLSKRWTDTATGNLVVSSVVAGSGRFQSTYQEVRSRLEPGARLARYVLEHSIQSPLLASLVDEPLLDRNARRLARDLLRAAA